MFRYAGDPNVFDGIEVASVAELIDLGLIDARDVLLSETFVASDPEEPFPGITLTFEVDVTGVPDEEIVVFNAVTQDAEGVVPALSGWGRFVLAVLMLGAIYLVIRR